MATIRAKWRPIRDGADCSNERNCRISLIPRAPGKTIVLRPAHARKMATPGRPVEGAAKIATRPSSDSRFAVELLLLLRLLFLLFGAPASNVGVAFVYTVSTFFLLPFYSLLENVKIPLLNGTELYSDLLIVCAIFVYGLLSRILVRFFKALLNSR